MNEAQQKYLVREIVAVFESAEQFEAAFAALESAGFNRADISLMGSHDAVAQKLGHRFASVRSLEDDGSVPQGTMVSEGEVVQAKAAAFGLPFYVGVTSGALAIVASGGGLAMAIAAAVSGGLVGGGAGAVIAGVIGDYHAKVVEEHIRSGGLLLWVTVNNDAHEAYAIELLKAAGGTDVHPHIIKRTWGVDDIPLHSVQPDPLLEKGTF